MTENYRIVKWGTPDGDVFQIHRVFYSEDGVPTSIEKEPVRPAADSGQHLSNLLMSMCGAFREEVINGDAVVQAQKSLGDSAAQAMSIFNKN